VSQGPSDLDDGDFALATNDHIDEGLAQSFVWQQGRVPSAEDDREPWRRTSDSSSNLNGAANHRPGKDRDADAESIDAFALDSSQVVRLNRGIDHHDVEVGFAQRSSERQQA
jgi:hypothetical protein